MEYNDYSCLIYKHPFVENKNINNYRSLVCVNDIEIGELLALEHIYCANKNTCIKVVENNECMFNMYFPRTQDYKQCQNKYLCALQKVSHNIFGFNGNTVLNIFIQQINHSCKSNCVVIINHSYNKKNTDIAFMELYAIKKISAGEEITINYGPHTSHNRDFQCNCGLELDQRIKIYNIGANLGDSLSTKNKNICSEYILKYLKTDNSKKILLNQYLAVQGIYISNGSIVKYNLDGWKLINRTIENSVGKEIANKMPINKKIEVFMNILIK